MAFLLNAVSGIDTVVPIDTHSLRSRFADRAAWGRFLEPLREVRSRRYDIAIDFQGLVKTALLTRISGSSCRVGFSRELVREPPAHWFYQRTLPKPDTPVHIARLNLMLAQQAGAVDAGLRVSLRVSEPDSAAIDAFLFREQLEHFVVLNPGGGWPTKRWSPDRYGLLAAKIQAALQLKVVITTGPGEEHLFRGIATNCPELPPVQLEAPFLRLIPLFRRARLVVGGDTGPLHLACALGTPVVGIFGPTAPARNGPWSERDEVVVRHLPCSFCNGRSCPTANECMDISVEEVFAAVVKRLERGP